MCEARAILAEEQLRIHRAETELRLSIAQNALAEGNAERKLLIDRIAQMSGQPPIFHPAPAVAAPPAPTLAASNIPAPETRVSFSDVHRITRKAIKDGELNILARTN